MAGRNSGWAAAAALGIAAGGGAAQLGLAYGLEIIAWPPTVEYAGGDWTASMAWAVWIAAMSTVVGAVCAQRLVRSRSDAADPNPPAARRATVSAVVHRVALAVAAALGALVTVVLIAVPARSTADTASDTAVWYAVAGVALGLVATLWALSSRPAATNLIATGSWMWLLGAAVVIDGIVSARASLTVPLGVWPVTDDRLWFRDHLHWPTAALSLAAALLIGALTARSSAKRPERRVGAAVSGLAGPVLVAAAYLVATPRLAEVAAGQRSAHQAATFAVLAGVIGSALVAALAQRGENRLAENRLAAAEPTPQTTETPAVETPTAETPAVETPAVEASAAEGASAAADAPTATAVVVPSQPSGPPPAAEKKATEKKGAKPRRTSRRRTDQVADGEADQPSDDGGGVA